jgi:hypothetical protein
MKVAIAPARFTASAAERLDDRIAPAKDTLERLLGVVRRCKV